MWVILGWIVVSAVWVAVEVRLPREPVQVISPEIEHMMLQDAQRELYDANRERGRRSP